jgi:hypothetical protein
MVRLSGWGVGPRIRSPEYGDLGAFDGAPPAVSKRARAVSVRNRSVSSVRFVAVTSKEVKTPVVWGGVRMPA